MLDVLSPYSILSKNLLASGFFKIVENLPMAYPLDIVQDYCELISFAAWFTESII